MNAGKTFASRKSLPCQAKISVAQIAASTETWIRNLYVTGESYPHFYAKIHIFMKSLQITQMGDADRATLFSWRFTQAMVLS